MDDAKPPVVRSNEMVPAGPSRFPRRAAMFSLAAPFLGIGLNLLATLVARHNRVVLLLGALATILLILFGLLSGILALVSNRKLQLEGVTPRAVGGVCISGFLILMMASGLPGLLRALEKADGRDRRQPAEQNESR
jgi:hypothetical protein